jgi:hypothetical protein
MCIRTVNGISLTSDQCCSSPQTVHTTLNCTLYRQLENQAPNTTGSNLLYNNLELLMIGIKVPETCWASNKIYNKNHLLHLVGILLPHMNDDARSKPLQNYSVFLNVSPPPRAQSVTQICTFASKTALLIFLTLHISIDIDYHYFTSFLIISITSLMMIDIGGNI